MKILPLFKSSTVDIAKYYTRGVANNALYRLDAVREAFVPYAKAHNVSLKIDKASKMIANFDTVPPKLKELLNRSISINVTNNKNRAKTKTLIIDASKDNFLYQGETTSLIKDNNGRLKYVKTKSNYEDNFIRAVFRAVENLTKKVTKK